MAKNVNATGGENFLGDIDIKIISTYQHFRVERLFNLLVMCVVPLK